jgi:5-methylcytosine-specific restriction endonuclease McrA
MANAIISRKEAKAQGLIRFFTGKPCKYGHVAERWVSNKVCTECREQKDRSKKKNIEKQRATVRAWYHANAERVYQKTLARRRANPDKQRAHGRNRRARLKEAEGHHTAEDIQCILKAQKGKCALCRVNLGEKYEVDHITPISAGGSNWPRNLQVTCVECNRSKGTKDPISFAQSLGFLL